MVAIRLPCTNSLSGYTRDSFVVKELPIETNLPMFESLPSNHLKMRRNSLVCSIEDSVMSSPIVGDAGIEYNIQTPI